MPRRLLRDRQIVDDEWRYVAEARGRRGRAADRDLSINGSVEPRYLAGARQPLGRGAVACRSGRTTGGGSCALCADCRANFPGPARGAATPRPAAARTLEIRGRAARDGLRAPRSVVFPGALRLQQLRIARCAILRTRHAAFVNLHRRLPAVERSRACRSSCRAGYTCQRLKRRPTFWPTMKRSASKRSRLISASSGSCSGWPSAHRSKRTMGPITRTATTVAGQPADSGPISISWGRIKATARRARAAGTAAAAEMSSGPEVGAAVAPAAPAVR